MTENVDYTLLVDAFLAKEEGAFERLMAPVKRDLWCYLYHQQPSRQDAEDLYQDVCLKVVKNVTRLKNKKAFRSWVFSVAMNAQRTFWRKKKGRPQSVDRPVFETELRDDHPAPDHQLRQSERFRFLGQMLKELEPRARNILVLEAVAGLPQKDIADMLDINLNTLKTVLRRTRIRLARAMVEH